MNCCVDKQRLGTIHDLSSSARQISDPDIALEKNRPLVSPVPDMEHLLLILRENSLNWFALVGELRTLLQNYSEETLTYALTEFSDHLPNLEGPSKEAKTERKSKRILAQRKAEQMLLKRKVP